MDKKNEDQTAMVANVFGGTDVAVTDDIAFDGPSGFEGVDSECITIPFLKMAQSATDETKKGSPKRIEGLEPGMFFCPATRRVYGETAKLIILRFYRQYVIYESREPDSKFMGTMSPEQFKTAIEPHARMERSFYLDSEGHRYVDTRNFIVLVASSISDGPMLLSMSSTGIAPSKKWMTQAQNSRDSNGKVIPIWGGVWEVSTGYFDNPQGSYYQVSRISRLGNVAVDKRPLVVNYFLDAQGAGSHELDQGMAKAAPEDGVPVDGTHEEADLY